jgi:hypothetical protein
MTGLRLAIAAVGLVLTLGVAREVQAQCYTCISCVRANGQEGHGFDGSLASSGSQGLTDPDPVGDCEAPTCATCLQNGGCHGHSVCTGTAAALEQAREVESALRLGNVTRVAQLVQASKGVLVVNWARGAVQAKGCSGTIVAHIPVPSLVLASLPGSRLTPAVQQVAAVVPAPWAVKPARSS